VRAFAEIEASCPRDSGPKMARTAHKIPSVLLALGHHTFRMCGVTVYEISRLGPIPLMVKEFGAGASRLPAGSWQACILRADALTYPQALPPSHHRESIRREGAVWQARDALRVCYPLCVTPLLSPPPRAPTPCLCSSGGSG